MALQMSNKPSKPPRFTIDLSLPPIQRYKRLAEQYATKLSALTGLFDDLLLDLGLSRRLLPAINHISSILLRRVHNSEETEELRGISEQTGIAMYLLVSLNVVLDLLMGCTSGGVRSLERGQPKTESKMLHFRILDWGMNDLRDIIVQLDFIRSKSSEARKIRASSITYVGFVGCLTGVTLGQSISLNFRAVHDGSTWLKHFKFYCHHMLVLFGWQPSIASILRSYLFRDTVRDLATNVADFCTRRTTSAYVVFCSAQKTVVVEKDLVRTEIRESDGFVAVTNHDVAMDRFVSVNNATASSSTAADPLKDAMGMAEVLEESAERLDCIEQKWRKRRQISQQSRTRNASISSSQFITKRTLQNWLRDWPTTNECTHFAAIMDPEAGVVVWSEIYLLR